MSATDTPVQDGAVDPQSKQSRRKDSGIPRTTTTTSTPKSNGLEYYGDPKSIRKTVEPTLKKEIDILFDFEMPEKEELRIKQDTLDAFFNGLRDKNKNKAPRYWFNDLAKNHGYSEALWFTLNLKATLLNSANANLLKDWRLTDKVKIPPQDVQEVTAIASLYEQKDKTENDKIIYLNTRAIKDFVLGKEDDNEELIEERKEIILNIALGNLGGLYTELIEREKTHNEEKAHNENMGAQST